MKRTMHCPSCEDGCEFRPDRRTEEREIRGETIVLEIPLWVCAECGETIADEHFGDPTEKAFDAYREKHGLLKSSEIQEIRTKWNLSQAAFAALLGMSQATINRYEQGALQQKKEDELIRACANPAHMSSLLQRRGATLSDRQRASTMAALEGVRPVLSWSALVDAMPSEVSRRSGFRAFDYNRYAAVVTWLCSNVALVTQTKLYKLLFYTDYLCFKTHTRSLTGALYRHMPYGPVPVGFGTLRAQLEEDDYISVDEAMFQNGNFGEVFRPGPKATEVEAAFEATELRVLRYVRDTLGGLTPTDISDRSHQEAAWKDTPPKEVISYEKAAELSLSIPD